MIAAQKTQQLGQNAEVDAVVRVPVDDCVHRPVHMQQHPVVAAPLGQRVMRGPAQCQVIRHDDRRADLLGEFGALIDLFHRSGRHVHVVAFSLAGFGLRFLDGFLAEQEPVAPAHEGLRVDVFVVLGKVKAATQHFIDRTSVVLGREPQLGFDRAAQQGTAVLVHLVALYLNAVGRPEAGFHEPDRKPYILKPHGCARL